MFDVATDSQSNLVDPISTNPYNHDPLKAFNFPLQSSASSLDNISPVKISSITDIVVTPIVTIATLDSQASETLIGQPVNRGQFILARTDGIDAPLTVNYGVIGTATNGVDYDILTGNVTFAAGASTAIINVNPIDDKLLRI